MAFPFFDLFRRRKKLFATTVTQRQGEAAEFVDEGSPTFNTRISVTDAPERSRVVFAQYLKEGQTLSIEYADGAKWLYWPYTPEEAEDFFKAPSWGIWLWDFVLVRGEGNFGKHQRNAKQLQAGTPEGALLREVERRLRKGP